MNVVKFATPMQKMMESLRKSLPRLLRIYVRTAFEYHDCDHCNNLIMPGEMYIGKVYITPFASGKRIVVSKEHYFDCWPPPEEDEEREREIRDFEEHMDDLESDVGDAEVAA